MVEKTIEVLVVGNLRPFMTRFFGAFEVVRRLLELRIERRIPPRKAFSVSNLKALAARL